MKRLKRILSAVWDVNYPYFDIKGTNVLVDESENIVLGDLGTMSPLEEFKICSTYPNYKVFKNPCDMKFDDDKMKDQKIEIIDEQVQTLFAQLQDPRNTSGIHSFHFKLNQYEFGWELALLKDKFKREKRQVLPEPSIQELKKHVLDRQPFMNKLNEHLKQV